MVDGDDRWSGWGYMGLPGYSEEDKYEAIIHLGG